MAGCSAMILGEKTQNGYKDRDFHIRGFILIKMVSEWQPTQQFLGKRLYGCFSVSWDVELFESILFLLGRWSWKGPLSVTLSEDFACSFLCPTGHRATQRMVWKWLSISNMGEDCTFIVQVSWKTKLESIVLLRIWLEMTIYQWHWGSFCTFIVQVYLEIEVFKLIQ